MCNRRSGSKTLKIRHNYEDKGWNRGADSKRQVQTINGGLITKEEIQDSDR